MAITVVGLGPGDGDQLTRAAWRVLTSGVPVYARTARHPAIGDLPAGTLTGSFDELYETADAFESVYAAIVTRLLDLGRSDDIVYAVPGHPYVGESTVPRLVAEAEATQLSLTVVDGISFIEPILTTVGYDALDGFTLHDALDLINHHYPPVDGAQPLMVGQVYSQLVASELKLVLNVVFPDEHEVMLVHNAGADNELVETMPLYAIDRSPHLAHLTSLWIPPLAEVASLPALAETIATLRAPDGCPWDQKQTPETMREGLIEETAEVLAAIDAGDFENLAEELGDLLLHIVFQAQMATESGQFNLRDVVASIDAKLKFRHPHIWGDTQVSGADEVLQNWEALKAAEKAMKGIAPSKSAIGDIAPDLSALLYAQKIQARVAKVGFDWPDISGVYAKLDEELEEVRGAQNEAERVDEVGDLLFVAVNLARWHGVNAELALRDATQKFTGRFQQLEELAQARRLNLTEMSIDALDVLWEEAKQTLHAAKDDL